jgi:hypothetical protein
VGEAHTVPPKRLVLGVCHDYRHGRECPLAYLTRLRDR